jgi:hypothetical protein
MKNSFYREIGEMADEAIEALNSYEQNGNSSGSSTFDMIRRVAVPCWSENSVRQDVLEDFPLREHMNFRRAIAAMVGFQVLHGRGENQAIRSNIEYIRHWTTELSNRSKRSGTPRLFYSWQATTKGSANRNLIRASLSKALDELNEDLTVEGREEITLDSDTANTPGSPDIINVILEKIDSSTLFVADVTFVNGTQPNSNVMFELGYALKSLGDSNIILLFNEHYGQPKDLPFDLGFKRALLYRCDPDAEEKAAIKKELAAKLKAAVNGILSQRAE